MKPNLIIALFVVLTTTLILSCQSNKKVEESRLEEENKAPEIVVNEPNEAEQLSYNEKLELFKGSSHRDTVLTLKLINGYNTFSLEEDSWPYELFDSRHEIILPLLESLLLEKENGTEIIDTIENNLQKLLQDYRDDVIEGFEEYHGLTGRTIDVLRKRKDTVAYVLSKRALTDSLVSEPEKEFARSTLAEYYSDWNF